LSFPSPKPTKSMPGSSCPMAIRNRAPLELMLDTGLLRRGHLNGTTQGEHEAPPGHLSRAARSYRTYSDSYAPVRSARDCIDFATASLNWAEFNTDRMFGISERSCLTNSQHIGKAIDKHMQPPRRATSNASRSTREARRTHGCRTQKNSPGDHVIL
jgi:hypothetical protein